MGPGLSEAIVLGKAAMLCDRAELSRIRQVIGLPRYLCRGVNVDVGYVMAPVFRRSNSGLLKKSDRLQRSLFQR